MEIFKQNKSKLPEFVDVVRFLHYFSEVKKDMIK